MSQDDPRLQRFDILPPYTTDLRSTDAVLMWSGPEPVPAIGADVVIRINGIGRGRIISYASYWGYLGLMVMPHDPPAWWISSNGAPTPANAGLTFGAEIALIETAQEA